MIKRSLLCAFAALFFANSIASAQDLGRIAILDPVLGGVDYKVQGEYEGLVGNHWCGMQVVAMGGGQFQAVLMDGGLPGSGWKQTPKQSFAGQLRADSVLLSGETGYVEIASEGAWVRNLDGRDVGKLRRVARISPSLGLAPPPSARVLFDGRRVDGLVNARIDETGLLDVGFTTEDHVHDFQLHVEFRTPFMPNSRGQSRGNSGVYIQRRYEVQVLDSFGLEGVENECGGLYRQRRPNVNMCLPPLVWQSYDIFFRAARWSNGKRSEQARITVFHNGVGIHNNYVLKNKTGAGKKESPEPGEILFQNHRDPVRFRNLWIVQGTTEPSAVRAPVARRWSSYVTRHYSTGVSFPPNTRW